MGFAIRADERSQTLRVLAKVAPRNPIASWSRHAKRSDQGLPCQNRVQTTRGARPGPGPLTSRPAG